KENGTVVTYKGPCISGLWTGTWILDEPKNLEYRVVVRARPWLTQETIDSYLFALNEWGFGSYEVGKTWTSYRDTVNITKWFSIYNCLRYMWEWCGIVWLWNQLVYHNPTLDKWLLF